MTALIVEDEELALEKLRYTLKQVEPSCEVVGYTGSIEQTVTWLQNNKAPDVILMDIELSDGQSFEIFNRINVESSVIFITSYDEFAIKAFKVNSIDYLLKPVQKTDLKAAFDKYKKTLNRTSLGEKNSIDIDALLYEMKVQLNLGSRRNRFLVKVGSKHISVDVANIAYFYVEDKVVLFITKDHKRYVLDYSMEEVESMLEPRVFFRINRSFMVSISSIQRMDDYFNGRIILQLEPSLNKEVIVSRERVHDFKIWMGQ
jgi:DNA-binding LytR/AlgR family response regulator